MSNVKQCQQCHWNLQISVLVFVFNSESAPSPSAAEEKMPRFCWLLILLLNKFGLSDQIGNHLIISWFKNSGMFLFWYFYPPCVCFCGTVSWLFHYFGDFKITRGTCLMLMFNVIPKMSLCLVIEVKHKVDRCVHVHHRQNPVKEWQPNYKDAKWP